MAQKHVTALLALGSLHKSVLSYTPPMSVNDGCGKRRLVTFNCGMMQRPGICCRNALHQSHVSQNCRKYRVCDMA